MLRSSLVLLVSVWFSGCCFGRTPAGYPPAQGPRGATVHIVTMRDAGVQAELLAVSDTALFVHGPPGVMLVPYAAMALVRLPDLGIAFGRGRVPSERVAETMRLNSRLPQGISPELLQQLLTRYEQAALVVVER